MKRLILALLLFPVFAQTIPEKANQIIISNKQTAYANFVDVKILLTKKGIEISNQNKEEFEVKSGLIEIKGAGKSYYIFTCRDDKIMIAGKTLYNTENKPTDGLEQISNVGVKGSRTKLSFEAMNDFAKLVGPNLKYEVLK